MIVIVIIKLFEVKCGLGVYGFGFESALCYV